MKAQTNGIRINYEIHGEQGPWVVLSHSLACNLRMWDGQIAQLRRRYRVLAFDTRGHGGSDAPAGAYDFEMLVDDLHGLLAAAGVEQPHFVGLSMGGMIGMWSELRYPGRLRSLVLCDTSSRIPPEAQPVWQQRIEMAGAQGMAALVDGTLARWFTEPFRQRRRDAIEPVAAMIRSTPVDGYVGCCHAIRTLDITGRLGKIACPVQIIVGDQDAGTPVAMSEAIRDAIPGSTLVVIPQASHLSNIEQPEAFNRALEGFLAER